MGRAPKMCIRDRANAFPGVTIKALSKRATVIMLAFPEAMQHLPEGKRYEVVGIPVRQSFVTTTKRERCV